MLQRPSACDLEMYLSSRSPPDHLLYQMLKTVPVCAGIAPPLKVAGSTWARAGRRFFFVDFLGFVTVVEGDAFGSAGSEVLRRVVSAPTSVSVAAGASSSGEASRDIGCGDGERRASSEVSITVGKFSSDIVWGWMDVWGGGRVKSLVRIRVITQI